MKKQIVTHYLSIGDIETGKTIHTVNCYSKSDALRMRNVVSWILRYKFNNRTLSYNIYTQEEQEHDAVAKKEKSNVINFAKIKKLKKEIEKEFDEIKKLVKEAA